MSDQYDPPSKENERWLREYSFSDEESQSEAFPEPLPRIPAERGYLDYDAAERFSQRLEDDDPYEQAMERYRGVEGDWRG